MKTKIQEAKAEDINIVANNLRQEDINDLTYSKRTPLEALIYGYIQGCYSYYVDNNIAGMFGCYPLKSDKSTGILWFLGTDESIKYKRDWVKLGRLYISYFLSIYTQLVNIVSKKNKTHIKWLSRLGAKFYPSDKEGFYLFKITG